MRLLLTVFLVGMLAVPALAGPPIQGVYLSFDMPGGSFNTGYFSESWAGPGYTHGQIGNAINAESWDGNLPGTEWRMWCPSIATAPTLIDDTRDANGTGDVTWRSTYQGGHFWLGANGPWGDEDYTGELDFFIVTATYMYVFGDVLGIRSNVTTSGPIAGYSECFIFSINNVAFFGDTDTEPKPGQYPDFIDYTCAYGTLTRGAWGSVTEMAFQITGECQVATQESTWGNIKSLYQ